MNSEFLDMVFPQQLGVAVLNLPEGKWIVTIGKVLLG